MKHHIAVKFIAVFLASLALFAAVASGFGITALTALGLYENSVDSLYQENMRSLRQNFAVNLVHRYASLHLGELPEDYLNQYYGTHWLYDTFEYGYYFYTIKDENGNVVESTVDEQPANSTRYHIQVTEVNYRDLVQTVPWGEEFSRETETFPESTLPGVTEAPIPVGGSEPTQEDIALPATSIPMAEEETIVPATEVPTFTQPASAPTEESTQAGGTTEAPTEMPTVPEASPASAYEETGVAVDVDRYLASDYYYDHERSEEVRLYYTIQELPPYTVELYLLPGAMPEEHIWSLLRSVWNFRTDLFYVLGIGILVFAISAVYLCCSAGKRPGRDEIKAGGFNCLPLDLYLGLGGIAIGLLLVFGYEVSEYLLRYSPKVLVPFVAIAGYGGCLIFVGFCFACAAQLKTPDYYWWRNSITGRCFKLLGRLGRFCLKVCSWIWQRIPSGLRWCFLTAKKIILWAWNLVVTLWMLLWRLVKRCCLWCGRKLARMYGLLPLTWQWLLVGILLISVFLMSLAVASIELLWCGVFLAVGVLLYGAHAFGILMEGAKRMGKGDLETKVSDQFLLGSFQDFSKDLNALADVAMVAAQKQMKSERMKTELITNVSHDIKTPLTSIINYVDLLQKPHTEEEQEIYLEVLSRQSQQLKKLIEDLMEMSKASTGNMAVDITEVNAAEAINQALGEFADKLTLAQLIPVFRPPEVPVYMMADGKLVWRVMSNLLSNAVKYALPGTRLYIDLARVDNRVMISMKNISREELNVSADELLERFVRGDASRNTEGSGLGLNIAQSLMELQHGQLQLLVDGDLFKVTLLFPAAN